MSDAPGRPRWVRVRELFDQAAELSGAAREQFLDDACGADAALRREVASLLAFDVDDQPLDRAIDSGLSEAAAALVESAAVQGQIGPYALRSELGRGGMGTVYLAERADGQRVAVKICRMLAGPDLLRRFHAERQIVASLSHPGIARFLDGGTTPDGLLYLVMEHVDGVAIDEYCDRHRLSTRQRVDLFRHVCDAVAHAHRSFIVHRDLKPSNILITADARPKLIDFGIARLVDASDPASARLTAPSARVMTPHFASPEQVRGELVTTAADVYSLGVVLFTLLSGARPYELHGLSTDQIVDVVSTREPEPPSVKAGRTSRGRELAGDLDAIVMTALRKEPERRYGSVDALADDLGRYLARRPVTARPASWTYRPLRFVQRHPISVTVAALFAVVLSALSAVLVTWGLQAIRERDTATRVSTMLVRIFSDTDRPARDGERTARELLDDGASLVRRELPDQPAVRARLLDALGAIYAGQGLLDEAGILLREAAAARREGGSGDSAAAARTLSRLADTLRQRREYDAAEAAATEALAMSERIFGRRNPETARALTTLGLVLHDSGRVNQATPYFDEATTIISDILGSAHPAVGQSLANVARNRHDRGDFDLAAAAAGRAMAMAIRAFGPQLADNARALAAIVERDGRADDAAALRREAERVLRDVAAQSGGGAQ